MRSIRSLALVLAGAFVAGASTSSTAEDLDLGKTLDAVKVAIAEKHYGRASTDLQAVLAEVARLRADNLKTVFPAAPAGWTAEEATATDAVVLAAMGGGVTVRREYRKDDGPSVSIEMFVGGPWIASLSAMLSNPMFAGAGVKIVTVKGRRGMLEFNAENKRGTLQILLNGSTAVVKFEGSDVSRDDLEKAFAGAFDYDAAEKAAQD
jgi:hypothetical protein